MSSPQEGPLSAAQAVLMASEANKIADAARHSEEYETNEKLRLERANIDKCIKNAAQKGEIGLRYHEHMWMDFSEMKNVPKGTHIALKDPAFMEKFLNQLQRDGYKTLYQGEKEGWVTFSPHIKVAWGDVPVNEV